MEIKRGAAATKARALAVYERLLAQYPDVHCTLDYKNPFQLLIMTILAAQSTDARVNVVARNLFKQYKRPADFVAAPVEEVEVAIHSCGFYRAKARNIKKACADLVEKHGGEVPGTLEDLVQLAGVGRKTANVVLGECFGVPGVVVDTHCTRVTNRLGFSKHQDAVKIEKDLMKIWQREHWTTYSHLMVFHGRAICVARAPKCSECPVNALCPFPRSAQGKKIAR